MFLDPNGVDNVFAFHLSEIMPSNDHLEKFASYLVDVYISETALYSLIMWAVVSASISKTTNACESFHSHFNASFSCAHSHLFIFLNLLKDFHTEMFIKIQSIDKENKSGKNVHTKNVGKKQKSTKFYFCFLNLRRKHYATRGHEPH